MHGAFLDSGALSWRTDLPEPEPRPGWTRIALRRAGICATDQALARGYMGFRGVPGHEFAGIALDGPLQGRRVVGEINAGCGACADCRAGDPRHCKARTVLGIAGLAGAFCERFALPTDNLLPVPDAVDDDAATFTEPLAAALHIADDVDLRTHRRAIVAGDGKLGLLCAMALRHHGCQVTVVGRHAERAALLGADIAFATGWLDADGVAPAVVEPFDLGVEATGNPAVLPRLLGLVRRRGTIVVKTTSERPVALDLAPLVVDEQRLVGSRCGRFAPALDLLASGAIDPRPLIAARYPLDQAAAAFAHASRRGVLKVLLTGPANGG